MRCATLILIAGVALTANAVKLQNDPASTIMGFAKTIKDATANAEGLSGRALAKAALYNEPAKAKEIEASTRKNVKAMLELFMQKSTFVPPQFAGIAAGVAVPIVMANRATLKTQEKIMFDDFVGLRHPFLHGSVTNGTTELSIYLDGVAEIFTEGGMKQLGRELDQVSNVTKTLGMVYDKINPGDVLKDEQVAVVLEVLRSRGFEQAVQFLNHRKPLWHAINDILTNLYKFALGDFKLLPKIIASTGDLVVLRIGLTGSEDRYNLTNVNHLWTLIGDGTQLFMDSVGANITGNASAAKAQQESFHKFVDTLRSISPSTATTVEDAFPRYVQAAGFAKDLASSNSGGPNASALAFRKLADRNGVFKLPAPVSAFFRDVAHMVETNTMVPDNYMPRATQMINEAELMSKIKSGKNFEKVPKFINGYLSFLCALDGVGDSIAFCSGK